MLGEPMNLLRGPWLFARSRGLSSIPLIVIGGSVIVLAAPMEAVNVPLRLDALTLTVPAAISISALAGSAVLRRPDPLVEQDVLRLRLARGVWWLLVLASLTLPAASLLQVELWLWGVRNVAFLLGVTTLAGLALPGSFTWCPGALLLGLTTLYGWGPTLEARWWAVLAHPIDTPVVWLISAVMALGGCVAYVRHDQRG